MDFDLKALEVLCGLIDEMTEIVQDKMCLKWIAKFKTSLLGTAAVSHTGTLAKGADTGERSEGDDASTDGSNVRKKKPRNKGKRQRHLLILLLTFFRHTSNTCHSSNSVQEIQQEFKNFDDEKVNFYLVIEESVIVFC